jgi:hypothetical protein
MFLIFESETESVFKSGLDLFCFKYVLIKFLILKNTELVSVPIAVKLGTKIENGTCGTISEINVRIILGI